MFQCAAAIATLVFTTCACAHHSFAMFDRERRVELHGTVKKYEWTNPHIWIDLVVEGPAGQQLWGIEGGSPSVLRHSGFDKDIITPGMKVTVWINPLKNGSHGGSLLSVTLADGRVLDASPGAAPGSTGSGPPAQTEKKFL